MRFSKLFFLFLILFSSSQLQADERKNQLNTLFDKLKKNEKKVFPFNSIETIEGKNIFFNYEKNNNVLNEINFKFDSGQTPIIKCTIDWCKCGMCTPKSYDLNTFKNIMKTHTTVTYGME